MVTKRSICVLSVAVIAGAIAGWEVALSPHRDRVETARLGTVAKAHMPSRYFASLVRKSDAAVIAIREGKNERPLRITDPAWFARLSTALENASCEPIPHGLWVSYPMIRLYRGQTEILSLMTNGKVLRGLSDQVSGDYIVGLDSTAAIRALADQTTSSQPTPNSVH